MSDLPEVLLAREAEFCYPTVAMEVPLLACDDAVEKPLDIISVLTPI
jgi:purine nucleoside phosphorylase